MTDTSPKAPKTVHLLILSELYPSSKYDESQELHTSLKAAKSAAQAFLRRHHRPGATRHGSLRSKRVMVSHPDIVVTATISTITDPPVIQTLWRYWLERGENQ